MRHCIILNAVNSYINISKLVSRKWKNCSCLQTTIFKAAKSKKVLQMLHSSICAFLYSDEKNCKQLGSKKILLQQSGEAESL
jgi:hypothetical protein